jgi:hypothetical protein
VHQQGKKQASQQHQQQLAGMASDGCGTVAGCVLACKQHCTASCCRHDAGIQQQRLLSKQVALTAAGKSQMLALTAITCAGKGIGTSMHTGCHKQQLTKTNHDT